jgi:drug/metabolite transporter (DMT)-like permease
VRDWGRTIPALPLRVVTGWSGVLLVMLPVYLGWMFYGGAWLAFDPADARIALASIAYIAFLPTMLGNLFYLFGVTALGPARAAAFLDLSPLFSAALAIAWLGERIAWYHLAGIAAIFLGLYLLGRSPARSGPSSLQSRLGQYSKRVVESVHPRANSPLPACGERSHRF